MLERGDFDGFCRQEHPRLVRSMTLFTSDADLAVEIAQEAMAKAWRDWGKVSALQSPGGWTHRVAVNLARSHFRRRRFEQLARARAARVGATSAAPPDLPMHVETRKALVDLPARQREAVILRYLLDLSVDDTALRMGCAAGTVRALTAQALQRLRQSAALRDLEDLDDD